jgi:hypothetical protein
MFARQVPFTTSPTNADQMLLARLGEQLGLATFDASYNVTGVNTTGPMVIILTAIQNVSANACMAYDGTTSCPNLGMWVVTQQITIGNANLRKSNYLPNGVPAGELDSTTGVVLTKTSGAFTYPYYLSDPALQLTGFTAIPINATTGFPPDTPVYMAEGFLSTPGVPGFIGGGGIYTNMLF